MMEMKIKIEAPDLAAAIEKLAAAISPIDPAILTPDEPRPTANPTPAPVATTAAPAAAPTPSPAPVTTAPPAGQTAAPGNAAPAPAPAMPVTTAPTYTLDQISKAGASLVDAGKMEPLLGLLAKYGVQAITQLQPTQYGVFATELRALGAQI